MEYSNDCDIDNQPLTLDLNSDPLILTSKLQQTGGGEELLYVLHTDVDCLCINKVQQDVHYPGGNLV